MLRSVRWRVIVLATLVLASCANPTEIRRTIAVVGANQSFNWAGYVQGTLEKNTTFHAVAADWIVPRARQR